MSDSFPLIAQLCLINGSYLECCAEKDSEMISQKEVLREISDICHWPREAGSMPSSVKCWHSLVHFLFKRDKEYEIKA